MRILLAGDNCTDVFVQGRCDRISPERPVVVFLPMTSGVNPGMAGNVLANIQSLSPEAEVVSLFSEKESIKTRYVDRASNQHLLRVDTDTTSEALSISRFVETLDADPARPYDAVVLSDYAKGFLNEENMHAILLLCSARCIPTFIDTKEILGDWSRSATVVKINAKEYKNQLAANVKQPWQYCRSLVVTQGGDGMMLFDKDGKEAYRTKRNDAKVHDVVGAGDTTLAALTVGYIEHQDLPRAMDFAAKASAIAVSKPGVVAVKREEVPCD